MNGILLIDKPSGWTSFDVVAKVRGLLRQSQSAEYAAQSEELLAKYSQLRTSSPKVKVGHAGTLDPLATGLLVILVGSYCKRALEFSKLDKIYEVTMKLGVTSTTGDEEGEKMEGGSKKVDDRELQEALKKFTGEIMQVPHAFSAIKVNGQRAYKLAREGKEVVIQPRRVTIYSITDVNYAYPEVKFTAKVSSGTYIRSMVEDIGKELQTGAYMTRLKRTHIGFFKLDNSLSMDGLDGTRITNSLMEIAETVK